MTIGPQTKAADALHGMKHRCSNEDFREAANRLAYGLEDRDHKGHYQQFREILLDMRFWPGGRIWVAIGSTRHATAFNCFLSGTIADSFVTGPGCIADRWKEAATTLRMGGGIGYDFSTLRPKGEVLKQLGGAHAGGPVGFLPLFNYIGDITAAVGDRRGAQMGILRCDHPDIEAFVRAKQNDTALRRFNLSIAATDAFLEAALAGKDFDLQWGGKVYQTIDAAALWEMIMRSTWDWGEPGIFFVDRVNEMNNLYYCETIAATNPCAEQPLPPYGACLLGSFNLVRYLRAAQRLVEVGESRWHFDFDQLQADIAVVVRAMDNVIDRTRYPLAEQKHEAVGKRRMGLGIMGVANAGEALGMPYGSPEFVAWIENVQAVITRGAYLASAELAKEKGTFPLFDAERYLAGKFVATLDDDVRDAIAHHGIRNSHLTSIAPTGTIAMCADNVSSSLEPVIAYKERRPVTTADGLREFDVEDYGAAFLGIHGRLASEVTAQQHIDVLCAAQRHVDSAISKTVNMTSAMPWGDFKDLYRKAWEGGAKSCSTFNSTGKRVALRVATEDEGTSCTIDMAGRRDCN